MVDRQDLHRRVEELVARMFHVAGFEQETSNANRRGEFEEDKVVLLRGEAPEKGFAFIGALEKIFKVGFQRRRHFRVGVIMVGTMELVFPEILVFQLLRL